ncbi:zinc finger, CCHC-type containing protein, partial [Tanacetum coccineum]
WTTSVETIRYARVSEKQKLTGPNFIDWYKQLRLVLSTEDKENYLEHPIPAAPVALPRQQVPPKALTAHAAWVKGKKEVVVLMLLTMDLEIQINLAHLGTYDMLQELKAMFSKQAEQVLLQTVREFHTCKQEEGQSISSHVLKMKGYIYNLERLGQPVGQNLAVSLILVSLNKDFASFVQNFNMHGMGKTVNELHAMLKLHEETLPKKDANPALHAIRAGRVQKNQKNKPHKAGKGGQGKGKNKMGYAHNNVPFAPKPKTPPPPKKDNPAKDAIYHQCCEVAHWRRNCHVYLAELMKKKSYLRELALQGLRGSKKLKPGALSLYVGDGHRAAVEAIGTYHLELPSGLVIVLNNCHYAPSITRGVISVSRLFDDGFVNRFDENNVISVSKNNLVYFMAVPRDGIFEIDMSCSNTNDSSMYAITNKRAKINLDSSLLWHCHLGHINKKRIEKLQHDGLLNSIDIESLGKCVSCLSGKMARKPYSHQVERAKDLLGLIHTDVCGPFRIVSRQGASYFVTFTDGFSRYGYVYLLKHKHELFETFKLFQKEVENQLGKTIKSLRSDRGGEYLSQEFLNHLKDHGIIAHRTPPYTPQHNGVLERRNRTLLDMALVKHDTLTKPDKLEPRALKYIFVGYPKETMGYSFYYPPENKIFVARNAKFFKNDVIDHEASGSLEDLEIIQEDIHPSLDTSLDHEEDDQ